MVYARPDYIETLATSTPIADHVPVDFELRGCPINKQQLLEVIVAFLAGRKPAIAAHSVCVECKQRGNVCVMVAQGHALPRSGDPCRLRRASARLTIAAATAASVRWKAPNTDALRPWLQKLGMDQRAPSPSLRHLQRQCRAVSRGEPAP